MMFKVEGERDQRFLFFLWGIYKLPIGLFELHFDPTDFDMVY